MANHQPHIEYSLADIEKYSQGKMSAAEMHEMEKAALQDPFLADALEGYAETSIPNARLRLDAIAEKITGKEQEEAKVVPIRSANRQWMRIAASVIVIAAIGTITWLVVRKQDNTVLGDQSVTTKQAPTNLPPAAPVTVHDSNTATKTAAPTNNITTDAVAQSRQKTHNNEQAGSNAALKEKSEWYAAPPAADTVVQQPSVKYLDLAKTDTRDYKNKADEEATLERKQSTAINSNTNTDKKIVLNNSNADRRLLNSNTPNAVASSEVQVRGLENVTAAKPAPTAAMKEVRGRIVNAEGNPVSYATVSVAGKDAKYATMTDEDGKFKLNSTDTSLKVSVSSIGYAQQTATVRQNFSNNITLQASEPTLSEVVVASYGTSKKRSVTASSATVNTQGAPIGGWKSFSDYVIKKKEEMKDQPKDSTDTEEEEGEVEVEFSVDKFGKPYNFNVVRSDDNNLANKAIKIVKDGPAWITDKKTKKAKVVIKF